MAFSITDTTIALPLISIITICYNALEGIEATMQSVLEQDYEALEYIVIDGGSIDGTTALIRKYENRLSYWQSEPDEGISDAFNQGLAQAKGEIIGLLNASDTYPAGALSSVAAAYGEADIYYGNMLTLVNGTAEEIFLADHSKLEQDMSLGHPATFISQSAYERWDVYRTDFKLAMDYELLLRMHEAGAQFRYIDETLAHMNTTGMSAANWRGAYKEMLIAQKKHLDIGLSKRVSQQVTLGSKKLGQAISKSPLSGAVQAYRRRLSKGSKKR